MLLPITATLAYCLGIFLFWRHIKGDANHLRQSTGSMNSGSMRLPRLFIVSTTLSAAVLHGGLLYQTIFIGETIDLALGKVVSLVCLMAVTVFLAGIADRKIANLGIFVLPIGLFGLIVGAFFPGDVNSVHDAPPVLWTHLGIALMAFAVLCIATAQALLLSIQEKQLHQSNPGGVFPALPSLQTMERILFNLTLIGVVLLTANLITGMWASFTASGNALQFNHHILFSFIAWLCFTVLLVGHKIYGWRGQIAAKWTISAFILLILAYFGTRFVNVIVLS